MKKWIAILAFALLLAGCGGPEDYETVTDVYEPDTTAVIRQTTLSLPKDAAQFTGGQENGAFYVCDGYSVAVQTLPGGDLDRTLRSVTGFGKADLQLFEQSGGDIRRYDCAWSCAGEGGDLVCRGVVLDDGCYHYVLTVLAQAEQAGKLAEQINALCASFAVN